MTNNRYELEKYLTSERLQALLTQCHNMLRSHEGLSPESAFRELNKLLFVKLESEKSGFDIYQEETITTLFEKVKCHYQSEQIFSYNDTITVSPTTSRDILGTIHEINFTTEAAVAGRAYEAFVQKALRGFGEVPVAANSIIEFVADVMNIKGDSKTVDPFCGYGGILTTLSRQSQSIQRSLYVQGYEKDPLMVQTAKLNLLLNGYGEAMIERSMDDYYDKNNLFDHIMTNIRFANDNDVAIYKALSLLKNDGTAALITSDDILIKEKYAGLRHDLMRGNSITVIISLPTNAVRIGSKQQKSSVIILKKGSPHDGKTLMARIDNAGISALGLPSEKNDLKKIKHAVFQWLQYGETGSAEKAMWVNLQYLDDWNVEAEFIREENNFKSRYPLYRLGDLVEIKQWRETLMRDEYNRVTVRKKQHDVVKRDSINIKDIKNPSRQTVVRKDQILVSRIDAKEGAIGIVPKVLDGAIVSDNFMVLNVINNHVDKFYLLMVLTSKRYQKLLKGISHGVTTRSYIKNSDLLGIEIPVPDMETQIEMTRKLKKTQEERYKIERTWEEGLDQFSNELFGL